MTLYEINHQINEVLAMLEPDPETGEIQDAEFVAVALEELEAKRADKLRNCAMAYFNAKASAESYKTEIDRLKKRKESAEKTAERILNILQIATDGEETDCGIATFKIKTNPPGVKVDDLSAAVAWLDLHGYRDFYTVQAPKLSANDVKKLLKSGIDVPGVHLESSRTAVLK